MLFRSVNFLAAYFTKEGNSLNQKAVNLHMLEDTLGWIVVLIGSIIMKFTNILVIDSILSILVAIFILIHALKSFKKVLDLFLEKTPNGISIEEIKKHVLKIKNIIDIHHIHIWSIDGYSNYATMHVVTNENNKEIKEKIRKELKHLGISHVTIEIESKDEICDDLKCKVDVCNTKHHHH